MSLMVMKHYPEKFKADAVALYLSDPSKTYRQVAEGLGINRATPRQCVLDAQRRGEAGPNPARGKDPAQDVASSNVLEQENQQLKARIRELERDVLRKAEKFFAGETNWWAASSSLKITNTPTG